MIYSRVCIWCDAPFVSSRSYQLYCSAECRYDAKLFGLEPCQEDVLHRLERETRTVALEQLDRGVCAECGKEAWLYREVGTLDVLCGDCISKRIKGSRSVDHRLDPVPDVCEKGHELVDGWYVDPAGRKFCRACNCDNMRRMRERRAECR